MKNKQKKTKQKGKSVQDLLGIKTFTKNGLKVGKEELIFYMVQPTIFLFCRTRILKSRCAI